MPDPPPPIERKAAAHEPGAAAFAAGLRRSATGLVVNVVLAATKISAGIAGNSYALVADGIESSVDVVSSLIVWSGLRVSLRPPDHDHPYGHGKAESLAGVIVVLLLLAAAALVAVQSVREIHTPHHMPAPFTLVVLVLIVAVKEAMARWVLRVGDLLESSALRADAWHHRSDALTSLAAFVGISLALIGGPGWESADDWAALAACAVIVWNAVRLLRPVLGEVMDEAAPAATVEEVRAIATSVRGVVAIEKCRVRKSGTGLLTDIHVEVDGDLSVREGHRIGHDVIDALQHSRLRVVDVVVHVEPARAAPEAGRGQGGPPAV